MILIKIYLIVLEIQLVLWIAAWIMCSAVVTSARTGKKTAFTECCCAILAIAKVTPEECVRTVSDVKFNLGALISALLWPVTLPIGIWNYAHQ